MDTSEMNGELACGILALSTEEIGLVSGGRSVVPTKSWWDRVMDWASGMGSMPTGGGSVISTEMLTALETACVNAGGDFHFHETTFSGGLTLRVANGSSSYTTVDVTCERN